MSFLNGENNPSKRPEVKIKIRLARQRRKEKLGCINLPETREKQRLNALKQFENGMPEETKKKMRNNHPKYWLGKKRPEISGENHFLFGRKHSEKTKEKIRLKRLNQKTYI